MLRQVGLFLICLTRFRHFASPRQSIKWVLSLRLRLAFTVHPGVSLGIGPASARDENDERNKQLGSALANKRLKRSNR